MSELDLFPGNEDAPPPGPEPEAAVDPRAPLAARMRPRTLDEIVGQAPLLGPGAPLRALIESGIPFLVAGTFGPICGRRHLLL
jgi:hypothetical protein